MKLTRNQKIVKDYNTLTGSERANAVHEFHKAMQLERGAAVRGHNSSCWSIRDTAEFFDISVGQACTYDRLGG